MMLANLPVTKQGVAYVLNRAEARNQKRQRTMKKSNLPKLPKPVLAWAPLDDQGLWLATIHKIDAEDRLDVGGRVIRVRIVPVRRKARRAKR